MKKAILIFLLGIFVITGVKSQIQPGPPSGAVIMVAFGDGNRSGELYFDENTQAFLSGWISYPVPYGGGLYYMFPVSVSGELIGTPLEEPEEPSEEEEVPAPVLPPSSSSYFTHFEGTVYWEQGSLVLHSGNNGVLQENL